MGVKEQIPVDILLVAAMVLFLDILILVLSPGAVFLRTVIGIPVLLFVPGYVLVSALFPGKDDLEGLERLVLSLGLSIVIVPVFGFALNFSPWGITLGPIMATLSLYIMFMCIITIIRRHKLPRGAAFSINIGFALNSLKADIASRRTGLDRALTMLLLFSIILATVTLAYALVTPREGEQYTEFYILGINGTAADYPGELSAGESGSVIVGVKNHEGEPENYKLEMRLDNRSLPLSDEYENIDLEDDGRWEERITFTPGDAGENRKLQFLLYREDDLTVPYRELHLWIDVTED